jgi:RNA polymerase sigma factor (sigma-70 family)
MHSDSATSINADTTLLGRYASSRDAQAFAELVKRYSGLVFSTARRITGNDHDAEDVAQQCFLELARHAGKFSGPVVGWLYRVACTRSLNARRDRATRNTYEAKVDPRRSETPAESEWAELEPLIDQAIASLPDDQHLALILHYFQQKSQAQIASDCGVDQSTISRRLTQAIESLRSTLKKAGVVVTAAALPTLMLAHPTQAAPPALAVALTKVGLAGIGKTRPAFPVPYAAVAGVLAVTLAAVAILRTAQRDSTPPTSAPLFASTAPASPLQQRAITLQDTAGHPMSHVLVGTAAGQIYNGLQTDINGKLPASKFARGGQQYLAYSQRSAKMAIFSAPTGTQNALTPIMLNMNAANADGNVVNSSGAPIAGVTVKIFATLSDGHDFLLTTSGNTDNSGYYSVGPIPSAAGLKIRASLSDDPADPDGTPAIDTAGLLQIEIPDLVDPSGLAPARNPGPARARYSGRILDESGRPIQGVIVSMSYPYQHMIGEAGDAVTDGQGRFSRLLPPGAQDVSFRLLHPDYMGFHFAPDVSVDTSALRDGSAVIVMKKGWPVSGVVRDAFGNPVFNALVLAGRLYSSTAGPGAETIEDCTTNRTDLQGRFRIGGLPEGKNRLVITADQFAPQIIPMNLSANAPALQVTLDTGAVFSGEVVDSAGHPLAGASVGCEEWNVGESRGEAPPRLAKTDPNGRFTLEHLPRQGELSFLATHKGFLGTMFKWSNPRGPLQTVTLY